MTLMRVFFWNYPVTVAPPEEGAGDHGQWGGGGGHRSTMVFILQNRSGILNSTTCIIAASIGSCVQQGAVRRHQRLYGSPVRSRHAALCPAPLPPGITDIRAKLVTITEKKNPPRRVSGDGAVHNVAKETFSPWFRHQRSAKHVTRAHMTSTAGKKAWTNGYFMFCTRGRQ